MSRKGALAAIKVLSVAHDYQMPRTRLDIYVDALADLDDDDLDRAVRRLVRTLKWFPKPAEVRAEAVGVDDLLSAPAAWAEVCSQIAAVGRTGVPGWSDPMISDAVKDCGGWRSLCDSSQPGVDRARFVAAWDSLAAERRRILLAGESA